MENTGLCGWSFCVLGEGEGRKKSKEKDIERGESISLTQTNLSEVAQPQRGFWSYSRQTEERIKLSSR